MDLNTANFRDYRKYVSTALNAISTEMTALGLIENAIPSYLHPNPAASWFFWKRLEVVMKTCRAGNTGGVGKALDFGCGAGVLFPFLQRESETPFWALDFEPRPGKAAQKQMQPLELEWLYSIEELAKIPNESLDHIIALDVLEHIDELDELLETFKTKLKSGGRLIVSSPTESFLYRIGRYLSGFTKHYDGIENIFHVYNAKQVEDILARHFDVKLEARVYPPLTLFRIVSCTKE